MGMTDGSTRSRRQSDFLRFQSELDIPVRLPVTVEVERPRYLLRSESSWRVEQHETWRTQQQARLRRLNDELRHTRSRVERMVNIAVALLVLAFSPIVTTDSHVALRAVVLLGTLAALALIEARAADRRVRELEREIDDELSASPPPPRQDIGSAAEQMPLPFDEFVDSSIH